MTAGGGEVDPSRPAALSEADRLLALAQAADLDAVRRLVKGCRACALVEAARGVTFGEGNPAARLLLIGEGPGEQEDRLGRPFVGPAGALLDRILEAAGFRRPDDVYITNVVKCRPPGNRVPTLSERKSCWPNLRAELAFLQPKIVVLLGRTALNAILDPKAGINQSRGQWVERNGVWFMPTYHPAALLRDPALKVPVWEDFKAVVRKYREVVDPRHPCRYA